MIAQTVVTVLLGSVIVINFALRYAHMRSHNKILQQNEQLGSSVALIKRDGVGTDIAIKNVVPGDIIILHKGDHVPADGRLLHATELHVKEYQLTGNEDPVEKHTAPVHSDSELSQRTNMVYRGTYVTSGTGEYVVTATGAHTEYSSIAHRITATAKHSTYQRKIATMTNRIILASLAVATALIAISLVRGAAWYTAAEYAIVLIVAAIPAMLPIIVMIITTQGIGKLASQRALFVSLRAIEHTSMLTTLVMGKTGFMVAKSPEIAEMWHPETDKRTFTLALSRTLAWHEHERDNIDIALSQVHSPSTSIRPAIQFLFDHRTQVSGNLWHDARNYELILKGSPEKILNLAELTENERESIHLQIQRMTAQGHQVLAVASCKTEELLSSVEKVEETSSMQFIGLIAFHYSPVPDAKRTIPQLIAAGITPRLATGDSTESAYILAKRMGLTSKRSEAIDARRLTVMPARAAQQVIHGARVYARTSVGHTSDIVASLKQHHVVAATGQGTDDTPILSRAHIGITHQGSASLAHDASDIVLLSRKNHLQTLYQAIKTSRSIVSNIRRAIFYTLTTNLAEVTIIISILLFTLPLALTPLQLLWSNIIVYTILVLGLAVEPDSRNIMKRRPASPRMRVLPNYLGLRLCILAFTMAITTLAVFLVALQRYELVYAQALAFHTFVVLQIVSALAARSDHTSLFVRFRTWSPAIYTSIVCIIVIQGSLLFSPLGQWLIGTTPQLSHVILATLFALAIFIPVSELSKMYSRRIVRSREEQAT